jgi:hypothetical protein
MAAKATIRLLIGDRLLPNWPTVTSAIVLIQFVTAIVYLYTFIIIKDTISGYKKRKEICSAPVLKT